LTYFFSFDTKFDKLLTLWGVPFQWPNLHKAKPELDYSSQAWLDSCMHVLFHLHTMLHAKWAIIDPLLTHLLSLFLFTFLMTSAAHCNITI
jgi:hypothetical protein